MAITTTQNNGQGIVHYASGTYTDSAVSPATPAAISLGFTPTHVVWENVTTRVRFDWYYGMTAGYAVQTAANGTRTLATSGGITVTDRTFAVGTAPAQNDLICWTASA